MMRDGVRSADDAYIGVIDQGTTGAGFVVFDGCGSVVSDGFEEHHPTFEPSGGIVYDPEEIVQSVRGSIQRALSNAPIEPGDLTAIGIANQRQTIVLWDADSGEPVSNAICWQDRRACPQLQSISQEDDALIRERTGLVPDPYFAGPKLSWLLAENPNLRRQAERERLRFGTIDAWLVSQLNGRHVTDITNASQTMLVDIDRREWDPALLDIFDIPEGVLPEIQPSSHPTAFGQTDLGGVLDVELPIMAVLGNQQAALLGHGGCTPGVTKISYGSGNFALQNVGTERIQDAECVLSTIGFQRAGEDPYYCLEAPVFATGRMIEWLDDRGLLRCEQDFRSSDVSRRPLVIPTLAGGGAPQWTVDQGGAIIGLTPQTDEQALGDATLEGIGFATRSALEAIESVSGLRRETINIDGSPIQIDPIAESQADMLDRDLVRPPVSQMSALGTAYAAGLAGGVWEGLGSLFANRPESRTFKPVGDASDRSERYEQWCRIRDHLSAIGR